MRRHRIVSFALVCAFTFGVASASAGAQVQTPRPMSPAADADDKIKDRIDFRLETSDVVRKYDVRVKVDKGVVTLSGDVATAAQKAEAEPGTRKASRKWSTN
jgi:osmotically-inducible protein OsmY